jgi:hypothetical protein
MMNPKDATAKPASSSPPVMPSYIRSYMDTAVAVSTRKRGRCVESGPPSQPQPQEVVSFADVRPTADLLALSDTLMSTYRDIVGILGDAPLPDVGVENGVPANDQGNDGRLDTEQHVGRSNVDETNTAADATDVRVAAQRWAECVAELQRGIRSKDTNCVKRHIRDQLRHEVNERLLAVRKMESTIGTVTQMT